MDAQRAGFVEGCATRQRHRQADGERAVRLDRQVRGLWLQQEPRRRLCAARLPDRLAEGASPARILRRVDVLRHGADRQARRSSSTTCAGCGVADACRPASTPARPNSASRQHGEGAGGPLRARRAEGRRRGRDGAAGRGARRRTARFTGLDDFAHRVDPRLLNKRQLETLAAAGAFDAIDPNRAGVFAVAETILAVAARTHEQRDQRAGRPVRRGRSRRRRDHGCRYRRRWSLARADGAGEGGVRLLFLRPSGRSPRASRRDARRAQLSPRWATCRSPTTARRAGATMAALVEDARWRTSARGRRYLMATLSDASGQFIATCFDDAVADGSGGGRARAAAAGWSPSSSIAARARRRRASRSSASSRSRRLPSTRASPCR